MNAPINLKSSYVSFQARARLQFLPPVLLHKAAAQWTILPPIPLRHQIGTDRFLNRYYFFDEDVDGRVYVEVPVSGGGIAATTPAFSMAPLTAPGAVAVFQIPLILQQSAPTLPPVVPPTIAVADAVTIVPTATEPTALPNSGEGTAPQISSESAVPVTTSAGAAAPVNNGVTLHKVDTKSDNVVST